jgi:hypothetical protein
VPQRPLSAGLLGEEARPVQEDLVGKLAQTVRAPFLTKSTANLAGGSPLRLISRATLEWQSALADPTECSPPCKTQHLLLVSILQLESRPNCQSCRGQPPSLNWQSYKQVAGLTECSPPCKTRHLLLVSRFLPESRDSRPKSPTCQSCGP